MLQKTDHQMDILDTALVGGLFAILVLFFLLSSVRNNISSRRKKLPPVADGAWPVIGHLHTMARSKLPHLTLAAIADKYGPVFSIRLGGRRVVVISNSEIAKECFTVHDLAISSRPKSVSVKHFSYNYALFGFAPYGSYWRELRKIASLELLSSRRIELLQHVRISETHTSISDVYKLFTDMGSDAPLKLELKKWFGDLSLNIVLRMVVGKRYFGAGVTTDAAKYQELLRDFFHLVGLFVVGDALPFLGWLDIGGHEKKTKRAVKELDVMASEWLEEHKRKKMAGNNGEDEEHDFMDVMLEILGDAHLGGFDPDTVNKATCFAMISGGSESASVTLIWALSLILNDPEVLQKAQEELDSQVGKERLVDESDIKSLAYLKAIIKETLRMHPAGPFTSRELIEDCTIGGYHVGKGTMLMVNLWKIQNDPEIWHDPSKFLPERFLTTHKDVDVKGKHYELLPFGSGRRICPGVTFGLQMVHLLLARFLQAFDVCSDGVVDMSETSGLSNAKATPLDVFVKPRLPLHLYGR